MLGDEISLHFTLFFMEIIFPNRHKPCAVISKAARCGFMSLEIVLFPKERTNKLIIPMPFGLSIGRVLIIISSLGFVILLFHPLLMSLATLILPKKFGTYFLLDMMDRVVLTTSSSPINFIRFVRNQVSELLYITTGWNPFGIN